MYKVWNGTTWVTRDYPAVYSGSSFVRRHPKYFDGVEWQPQVFLSGNVTTSVLLTWDVAAPTPVGTWHYATKSVSANWTACYRQNGSKRNDTTDLYQGYYSSTNGNTRSLVGFNVGSIPAGATCTDAKVTLTASHWYPNSGGTAVIGTHNKTSEPGSYSSSGVNDDRFRHGWTTKTGARTIDFANSIGQEFLDGTAKGMVFGPAPSTSTEYYGAFVGVGAQRPVLKLTYKWFA